jgi:4-amino-4-deoxy-L-arabinose transferase-like glycosyltransferase
MWQNIAVGLAVPFVIGITGLGFWSPPIYRAVAPWILGAATIALIVRLWNIKSNKVWRDRGYFDFAEEDRARAARQPVIRAWIALFVFMVFLWCLPHIMPPPPAQVPTLKSTK